MDAALTRREMKGIKSDRDVGRRVAPVGGIIVSACCLFAWERWVSYYLIAESRICAKIRLVPSPPLSLRSEKSNLLCHITHKA